MMTFSPSIASRFQVPLDAGEFLRDTAIVNIIDMDCKRLIMCVFTVVYM